METKTLKIIFLDDERAYIPSRIDTTNTICIICPLLYTHVGPPDVKLMYNFAFDFITPHALATH